MFQEYVGEFLVSCAATQLVLNWCSAGCRMCFANLNSPERTADPVRISNFLANLSTKDSLYAHMLQQQWPCLVSNLVDPFAASNYQIALPTMETMTELGIPIMIQTRGRFGIDDALSFMKPSHWYISINTVREDFRKKLEPGAASVQYRLDLIPKLIERGHRVAVGVNPIEPEWMNEQEIDWLLDILAQAGVEGIWASTLHLDNKQVSRLTAQDREIIGAKAMVHARKKILAPEVDALFQYVWDGTRARGMSPYCGPVGEYTDYFKPHFELYPKHMPVIQEFINWCFTESKRRVEEDGLEPEFLVTYDQFRESLSGDMPVGQWKTREYTRSISMAIGGSIPQNLTFEQLLQVFWSEYTLNRSLYRMPCFGLWVDGEDIMTDDDNRPIYFFNPAPGGWGAYKDVEVDWENSEIGEELYG